MTSALKTLLKPSFNLPRQSFRRLFHSNMIKSSQNTSLSPQVVPGEDSLEITWGGQQKVHYAWLRDHCPCPQCIHPDNRQKLHSSADVPLDIQPQQVQVCSDKIKITWDRALLGEAPEKHPHISEYDLSLFKKVKALPDPKLWNTGEQVAKTNLQLQLDEFINTEQGFKAGLKQMYDYGLLILKNCPTDKGTVLQVCEKFDHVYETFYGKTFDVVSMKKSTNIAYTSLFLGLHMDLMYFESPPGLQLLHSLKNSVTGGDSFFSDSFAAADTLRRTDPEAFETLCRIPVKFHYHNNGHHRQFSHPTIMKGDENESMRIYYAPPFQGSLDVGFEDAKKFYDAFTKFRDLVEDPKAIYTTRLNPGDMVVFNNRRVLHARTEFDPTSGDRHFEGAYIQWDDFKDKWRVHVIDSQ